MDGVALAVLSILTVALGGLVAAVVTLQVSTRNRVDALTDRLADTETSVNDRITVTASSLSERLAGVESSLVEQLGGVRAELASLTARFDEHERRVTH